MKNQDNIKCYIVYKKYHFRGIFKKSLFNYSHFLVLKPNEGIYYIKKNFLMYHIHKIEIIFKFVRL